MFGGIWLLGCRHGKAYKQITVQSRVLEVCMGHMRPQPFGPVKVFALVAVLLEHDAVDEQQL